VKLFETKKIQLFHYYSKTKGFYFRAIITQFKKFSHKLLQIGKTILTRRAAEESVRAHLKSNFKYQ